MKSEVNLHSLAGGRAHHSSPYSHVGAGMDSAVLHSHYAASQLVSKASTAADFTTPCHSTGATAIASSPPIYILRPEELSLFGGFLQTSLIFENTDLSSNNAGIIKQQ